MTMTDCLCQSRHSFNWDDADKYQRKLFAVFCPESYSAIGERGHCQLSLFVRPAAVVVDSWLLSGNDADELDDELLTVLCAKPYPPIGKSGIGH